MEKVQLKRNQTHSEKVPKGAKLWIPRDHTSPQGAGPSSRGEMNNPHRKKRYPQGAQVHLFATQTYFSGEQDKTQGDAKNPWGDCPLPQGEKEDTF
jgi:hypothetical protein